LDDEKFQVKNRKTGKTGKTRFREHWEMKTLSWGSWVIIISPAVFVALAIYFSASQKLTLLMLLGFLNSVRMIFNIVSTLMK